MGLTYMTGALYIVWGPHIYMSSMYNMLCWDPILWGPISTWAPCTACYVGGLDSVQCEVLISTWVHVMLGSYSVESPYLHGFHEQYVRPLCIVWGPHIYMLSHGSHIHDWSPIYSVGSPYLHGFHDQYVRPLCIVWGPHIYMLTHGSHIHDWSPIYSVGSPYLHGFHVQQVMLSWGPIVWGPHIYMGLTHIMLC